MKPEPPQIHTTYELQVEFTGCLVVVLLVPVLFLIAAALNNSKNPGKEKSLAEEENPPNQSNNDYYGPTVSPIPIGVPFGGGLYLNPW
jgi:hypothetical protein